ncbi:MAG: bifunctional demethylmenaquinone methyltransferase/2-methoxy-6-polyprenyl-1,4-benzoquinol methylase UbiE [Myxococcota bacterium]|jgi:demethylmenaquinone methyltransferase/2-methoxy-6-polyprenyl-1,4-benzoquinol methylase|nr:bifunctional demethylmenaquinone methyltransferase/2-methoxy-6-polyprenyl-1,4-benzoquinol methylase UbiE [Myxococcota bacterium]
MSEFSHSGVAKKEYVQTMFNDVAHRYDFLNRLLSCGVDVYWRKRLVQTLEIKEGDRILDVACGTGDVSMAILKQHKVHITGLDYASKMVELATHKATALGFHNQVKFMQGDAEALPFADGFFDKLCIAFGFRNMGHYDVALREFYRVLKPGGQLAVLELSEPGSIMFKKCYDVYFTKVLPKVAALLSRDDAYRYLPESVAHFPPRQQVCTMFGAAGFQSVRYEDLTFGACSIFLGTKT